ncbi:MAG TPA: DUF1015 domain-containing protein [Acidimicrobiales bacterium]|nr:DUF1015 domain-containing protein [Acidimicrobiales bacterium]
MPRFEPFAGLRYSLAHVGSLDAVVCPPYDVIDDDEREVLLSRSAYNVVRLELPVAPGHDAAGSTPYEGAAALLDSWRDGGVLARDHEPAFYGYRMQSTDDSGAVRSTVGVIGALVLEAPGRGILPHEETTPKAKSDRLQLLRALRVNTSPIWALTARTGLADLAGDPVQPAAHTVADGVVHELWPITDPAKVAAIRELVGAEPVLVADGHHRYETGLAYHREAGGGPEGSGAVMALVVELDDTQLAVQAIHRVVSGVGAAELLEVLGRHFTLTPSGAPDAGVLGRMREAGALAVVTAEGTWLAEPTATTTAAATHDLDSSRLDVALADLPDADVRYQHGWDLAAGAVTAGTAAAAVLLRPATVAQIAAISRGGVRMPPKTTFFWPKPRTGMVLRELAG